MHQNLSVLGNRTDAFARTLQAQREGPQEVDQVASCTCVATLLL